jgi:uncharacterized protein (DUF58 family)
LLERSTFSGAIDVAEQVQRDFLNAKVLSRLSGLPLNSRFPMLGSVSGRHRSPIRGSSLEFSEYRKYVPGDDTRRLDWRAYGRSDRFYIKEFEADTNLRMCLVVDTSGSMGFGIEDMTKLDYARRLGGTLAYLAARQGDAVGLYCVGKTFDKEVPPKRNAAHLRTVLDELGSMQAEGETGLDEALHEVAEKVRQRAMIIVISDLFLDPARLRSCFQHLRFHKHDVAVFHLLEQNELDFSFDRPVRFLDLEGSTSILADPSLIEQQYRKALKTYLEELKDVIRDTMVDYHRVCIHQNYDDVLANFLLGRIQKR